MTRQRHTHIPAVNPEPKAPLSPKRKRSRHDSGTFNSRVEHRRFELLTSSMPWKRATNCANAPGT